MRGTIALTFEAFQRWESSHNLRMIEQKMTGLGSLDMTLHTRMEAPDDRASPTVTPEPHIRVPLGLQHDLSTGRCAVSDARCCSLIREQYDILIAIQC